MNATDALNTAVFALKRVIALAEDYADEDPLYGLEQAAETASDALQELRGAGFLKEDA